MIQHNKNNPGYLVLSLLAILVLPACASIYPEKSGVIFERDGISVVVVDSDQRETYFYDQTSNEVICRAPTPDVSLTASDGVSLKLPEPAPAGKDMGIGENVSKGALSLGGRSPSVLIVRELLYRTCELSNNYHLSKEEAVELFKLSLNAAQKISESQTQSGTSPFDGNGKPRDGSSDESNDAESSESSENSESSSDSN